jgi:hypothetical protein
MTVINCITARQIEEVVHFTTNHGCLGTLYTKLLQSRQRLREDNLVKYLFAPNSELRKDPAYLDHVSLSISHINTQFFNVSANSWHRGEPIFWCILSFNPEILCDAGVEFATTNNIYTSVHRAEGAAGLEALFANTVVRWPGNVVRRTSTMPSYYPTCFQAEALYPSAISTEHLQRIYVRTASDQSEVIGFLKASFHPDVEVLIAPHKFGNRAS